LGLIIEEGLEVDALQRVVASVKATADAAGVIIVTGDTKVVGRGAADRLFVNTAGVGRVPDGVEVSGHHACPGDKILLSGSPGDHGIAVLSCREGLAFETELESDCAPLNGLVAAMLATGDGIHAMRDPTRGGLASVLNEIAVQSGVAVEVDGPSIPVHDTVVVACEMLGLDPLYIASEGKLVAAVAPEAAARVLGAMRCHEYGRDAAIIGEIGDGPIGRVTLRTGLGTHRVLPMLAGEPLPRIC
jgi:hydrogenase expression/formation protein HypE